jgi:hypothetical protein
MECCSLVVGWTVEIIDVVSFTVLESRHLRYQVLYTYQTIMHNLHMPRSLDPWSIRYAVVVTVVP